MNGLYLWAGMRASVSTKDRMTLSQASTSYYKKDSMTLSQASTSYYKNDRMTLSQASTSYYKRDSMTLSQASTSYYKDRMTLSQASTSYYKDRMTLSQASTSYSQQWFKGGRKKIYFFPYQPASRTICWKYSVCPEIFFIKILFCIFTPDWVQVLKKGEGGQRLGDISPKKYFFLRLPLFQS